MQLAYASFLFHTEGLWSHFAIRMPLSPVWLMLGNASVSVLPLADWEALQSHHINECQSLALAFSWNTPALRLNISTSDLTALVLAWNASHNPCFTVNFIYTATQVAHLLLLVKSVCWIIRTIYAKTHAMIIVTENNFTRRIFWTSYWKTITLSETVLKSWRKWRPKRN